MRKLSIGFVLLTLGTQTAAAVADFSFETSTVPDCKMTSFFLFSWLELSVELLVIAVSRFNIPIDYLTSSISDDQKSKTSNRRDYMAFRASSSASHV